MSSRETADDMLLLDDDLETVGVELDLSNLASNPEFELLPDDASEAEYRHPWRFSDAAMDVDGEGGDVWAVWESRGASPVSFNLEHVNLDESAPSLGSGFHLDSHHHAASGSGFIGFDLESVNHFADDDGAASSPVSAKRFSYAVDSMSLIGDWVQHHSEGRRSISGDSLHDPDSSLINHPLDNESAILVQGPTPIDSSVQQPGRRVPFRVLIVGAGLGGLCLAQALKKLGIASRVFSQEGDAYGAAWDDNDHRLANRLSLSATTLNALRHCLPVQNFRALVQHPTTLLPTNSPPTTRIPLLGRFLTAFFFGLLPYSIFSRPGFYTARSLFPVLYPGFVASALSTHLFGKFHSNATTQSLSVTIKTLRAILLAGLDVITPGVAQPDEGKVQPVSYFETWATTPKSYDAEYGLASVWNYGKSVVKVDTVQDDSSEESKPHSVQEHRVGVYFEEGICEVGDLVVDSRELVEGTDLDGEILWMSGLYPIPDEIKPTVPINILTSPAVIKPSILRQSASSPNMVLYTSPKNISTAKPSPASVTPGYARASRPPSRRVSYTLTPPTQPSKLSSASLEGKSSSEPASSPKALASPHFPASSPLAASTSAVANRDAVPPITARESVARQPSKERIVSKQSSRDSIASSNPGSRTVSAKTSRDSLNDPLSPLSPHRRTSGTGSTHSRAGSLRRITGASVNRPSNHVPIGSDRFTHVHWRLCLPSHLLTNHTTALHLPRDLTPQEVIAAVVGVRNGDIIKKLGVELVKDWNDGVRKLLAGSVGVGVSVDALAGKCAPLQVGPEVAEWVVELGGGVLSLKPFDAPHNTNLSTHLLRVRELMILLERSFSLTDIGCAPRIDSEARLAALLAGFAKGGAAQEDRSREVYVWGVVNDLGVDGWHGFLKRWVDVLKRAVFW